MNEIIDYKQTDEYEISLVYIEADDKQVWRLRNNIATIDFKRGIAESLEEFEKIVSVATILSESLLGFTLNETEE